MVKQLLLIGSLLVPSLLQGVSLKDCKVKKVEGFGICEECGEEIFKKESSSVKKQKIDVSVLVPMEIVGKNRGWNFDMEIDGIEYAELDYDDFICNYSLFTLHLAADGKIGCTLEELEKHINHVNSLSNKGEREIIKGGFTYILWNDSDCCDPLELLSFSVMEKRFKNQFFDNYPSELIGIKPTEDFFNKHTRLLLDFDFCGDEPGKASNKNSDQN